MTPEQQRFLLASYGPDWQTADLLLGADGAVERAKAGLRGGSMEWEGQRTYFQTDARGIGVGYLHSGTRLIIPWRALTEHTRALPAPLLDRLEAARTSFTEHQRAWPTPYPDLGVRKVGPSHDIHPDDRDLYHQRYEQYRSEVVQPWREQRDRVDRELVAAVRACLPRADDTAPVDLLDHLAAMEGGTP